VVEVRISSLDLASAPHGDVHELARRKLIEAGVPQDRLLWGTITERPMDLLGFILVRWTENPNA
jgi:hypothetical protein